MLEHRLLRERALGAEKAHLERLLLRKAGGHDLAEQPKDLLVAERPPLAAVALERVVQHLGFALRSVEIDRVPVRVLRDSDLAAQALHAR